ncbi:MAG TPA: DMT family transporter [Patescibacteria group bacterium]|nr:DMT family transporter [Patescibacteria group bacterium]
MYGLVVSAAIFSAFLDASAAVLQRRATGQIAARELFRGSILAAAIKHRLWVAGVFVQILAFFVQAIALANGPLVVVAPLLTTDLVFLLLLIHFGLGLRVRRRAWLAMLALALGLSGLLVATNPRGGHIPVNGWLWLLTFFIVGTVIAVGAFAMRHTRSIHIRAVIGGVTAGAHFGLTAAVTKLVLQQLQYGVWHEFASWELYALIIIGVSSVLTMQSMYGSGPLAITQPALEITVTLQGILIGIFLFGDHVNGSTGSLAITFGSALLLALGIIFLGNADQTPDLAKRIA